MPKKRKTSKAKERKVSDLSEHCDELQTKLNFSSAKTGRGHQGKSSQNDSLAHMDMFVPKMGEVKGSRSPGLVQSGGHRQDTIGCVDACFPLHPRASLSSRLHKGRILSRSAGDAVGQCSEVGVGEASVRCSEGGVSTKRRTVRATLHPRKFIPKYSSLPRISCPSRWKKAEKVEVCRGGRAVATCGDSDLCEEYLPLGGGSKRFAAGEESVVLLDSEEEEQPERDERGGGDKGEVRATLPKGSTFMKKGEEEGDALTVVDDSQDMGDNVSVTTSKTHPPVSGEGAGAMLHLSEEEEEGDGEGDKGESEAMDTVSGKGAEPEPEEMEEEKACRSSVASVGGASSPIVEMVLLSDEEKCGATEQTTSGSTQNKEVNQVGGRSFPLSPAPSKISEKFRVTPNKTARKQETTPTEQWEPIPVHLTCAPRKRSRSELDTASEEGGVSEGQGQRSSREKTLQGKRDIGGKKGKFGRKEEFDGKEREFGGKKKEFDGKEREFGGNKKEFDGKEREFYEEKETGRKEKKFDGKKREFGEKEKEYGGKEREFGGKKEFDRKEKEFGGKEKEFAGKDRVLQREAIQCDRCEKKNEEGDEEMEQGVEALSNEAVRQSERSNGVSQLFRSSGIGWGEEKEEEEEEDPLVIEESDTHEMDSSGSGAECKNTMVPVGGGHSPQREGEVSLSTAARTSFLHSGQIGMSAEAELEKQKSLTLKLRQRALSPLQQGLHDVNSLDEEGKSGMHRLYRGSKKKREEERDPIWKSSRQSQRKGALPVKDGVFQLIKKAGSVQVKKGPENSSSSDGPIVSNPFSKGNTSGGGQAVKTGAPRLSTEQELLSNDQEVSADHIQLGSLQLVATSPLHINSTTVSVSALANDIVETLPIQLRWEDINSVKLHWKTLPGLVVLRPSNSGASKLQRRLSPKGINGSYLNPEGKDTVKKYIIIQIPQSVHASVQQGILEILQQKQKSRKEFLLTEEEAESFMNMVAESETPVRRTGYALRRPRLSRPVSTPSIPDPFTDSDDSSSMPDVPTSFSQSPVKTYGQSSVNLCTETQRPQRRSTRIAPGFKLPSDLPDVDFTFRPQSSNQAIRCLSNDLQCLEEGEFLNDTIINLYLMYLWDNLPANKRDTVLILSSFFFTRLSNTKLDGSKGTERTPEREHARVKNWTKSVDIFSKDIVIVPVCYMSHWFLFIVMHPGEYDKKRKQRELERKKLPQRRTKRRSFPGNSGGGRVTTLLDLHSPQSEDEHLRRSQTEGKEDSIDITTPVADEANTSEEEARRPSILVLDSLGARRPKLSTRLVKYLNEEWRCKKDSEDLDHFHGFPVDYPKVPLQPNSSDCGIFLLHFVQELFEGPLTTGGQPEWSTPPNEFRRKLFTLVTELNSKKDGVPQFAHAQNAADS